jgi:hypothetical protein
MRKSTLLLALLLILLIGIKEIRMAQSGNSDYSANWKQPQQKRPPQTWPGDVARRPRPAQTTPATPKKWWQQLWEHGMNNLNSLGTPNGLGGGGQPIPMPASVTQYNQPATYPVQQPHPQQSTVGSPNIAPSWQSVMPYLNSALQSGPGLFPVAANLAATYFQQQKKKKQGQQGQGQPAQATNPLGWVGDLGYAQPNPVVNPVGWVGSMGYAPATMDMPAPTATTSGGFGTNYGGMWKKKGGGGGGGYSSNYTPAWMLALNQWNYGE